MKGENMDIEQIEKLNTLIHRLQLGIFNKTHCIDDFIIETVNKDPNITIKDLQSMFDIPQSTLSSAISRLCDKKILKRYISEEDTRSFTLQLTEEGEKSFGDRIDIKAVEKAVSKLDSDGEIDELIRLLEKIVEK